MKRRLRGVMLWLGTIYSVCLVGPVVAAAPVGAGTRYRVRFGRGMGTAVIEKAGFDRPRADRGSAPPAADRAFPGQVAPIPGGCAWGAGR